MSCCPARLQVDAPLAARRQSEHSKCLVSWRGYRCHGKQSILPDGPGVVGMKLGSRIMAAVEWVGGDLGRRHRRGDRTPVVGPPVMRVRGCWWSMPWRKGVLAG